MSNWGGYAANQGAFYLNEDAYLLIGAYSALPNDFVSCPVSSAHTRERRERERERENLEPEGEFDLTILAGTQVMLSTPGANEKGSAIIKDSSFAVWHSVWN